MKCRTRNQVCLLLGFASLASFIVNTSELSRILVDVFPSNNVEASYSLLVEEDINANANAKVNVHPSKADNKVWRVGSSEKYRNKSWKPRSAMMLLNITTADRLLRYEEKTRRLPSSHSIDVIIVGSKLKRQAAQAQFDSWGSHKSVRHFVLSTEYDDVDPNCHSSTMTWDDVVKQSKTCHNKRYWSSIGALNKFTSLIQNSYATLNWLEGKKNAAGWLCAQRRFVSSFTKLVDMYTPQTLPDYLIIADDDTYINMEHIEEYLIRQPARLEQRGLNQDDGIVPSHNTPVVFTGCKVRYPTHQISFTNPFGGFGTFLSKGSLKRWTQPLYCNDTANDYENNICHKLLRKSEHAYPSATVGEERYYATGDSLNDIFDKYVRLEKTFCLHSDWALGYIVNFLNISRACHPKSDWIAEKYPERITNRLHDIMGSEIYGSTYNGQCKYGNGQKGEDLGCHSNATVCHYVNETEMLRWHGESESN